MSYRYALYLAPQPSAPLFARAGRWLGRDPYRNLIFDCSPVTGVSDPFWHRLTAEPRLYGFHATLKPPFRLVEGAMEADLYDALDRFAAEGCAGGAFGLHLTMVSDFLALTPSVGDSGVRQLADAVVTFFDFLRALPSAAELARRRQAGLSARQDSTMLQWGYPWLFEEFRPHFTLTGRIAAADRTTVQAVLEPWFDPVLAEPFVADRLWLFDQPAPDAPFRQRRSWLLNSTG